MKIGILSDTHIQTASATFCQSVERCFKDCEVILHAGDLTSVDILSCFADKELHAVHGNMCDRNTQNALPGRKLLHLDGCAIGLAHGAGIGSNIENALWTIFPEADCIVYGHTHRPVCHYSGSMLFINPGSFMSGTAAILSLEKNQKPAAEIIEVAAASQL